MVSCSRATSLVMSSWAEFDEVAIRSTSARTPWMVGEFGMTLILTYGCTRRSCLARYVGDTSQPRDGWKSFGMNSGGQGMQACDEGGRWSIEKFVANAVHPAIAHGAKIGPGAIANNFFQGHAVARAAPGRDEHIRVGGSNALGGCLCSGNANKSSASGLN